MAVTTSRPGPRRPARAARSPPAFRLETHIFYLFSTILALRNRALNSELGRLGVDYPRWRVLAVLGQTPGASMLQLAELTSVDRTTLAHTVGLMVREGLVDRRARKTDRRSVTLTLTAKGRAILRQVLPRVTEQNERAMAGLSRSEAAALRKLLGRVLKNLKG